MIPFDKNSLKFDALRLPEYVFNEISNSIPKGGEVILTAQNKSKSVILNQNEFLLQGRGVKGMLSKIEGQFLFLQITNDNKISVTIPNPIAAEDLSEMGFSRQNMEHQNQVIKQFIGLKSQSQELMNLWNLMPSIGEDGTADDLICLPFLNNVQSYNYQINTVKRILNHFYGRILLCDEVGLGKTVEAGIAMTEYIARGLVRKILILVPPSLVSQWHGEMNSKFNQDFVLADSQEFKALGDKAWEKHNKVIASLSQAKRKERSSVILKQNYDLVIIDEAHHLKNRNTQAFKFVNEIKKKHIFLLTATPVQNSLEELYNLITLLKPGQLKTYSSFKKNFIGDTQGLEAKNVPQLKLLLKEVMIRNQRSESDVKFTNRFATTYSVNLPSSQKKLYDDISGYIREEYLKDNSRFSKPFLKSIQEQIGSSFNSVYDTLEKAAANYKDKKLQELANNCRIFTKEGAENPKLLQLQSVIDKFDDKLLIFTKYRATQELILRFLERKNITSAFFNGSLNRRQKEVQIEKFKDGAKVLVSTEAGSEGRNLQFCNALVNFDLPWNPMAIEQRIGRLHRVGQKRDVYVYNLAAKKTVESYILELLDKKINMFELVVGEMDMILGDIEDDIDFSDIVMNTWVYSSDEEEMIKGMDEIGEKMIKNKEQQLKIKDLENALFTDLNNV